MRSKEESKIKLIYLLGAISRASTRSSLLGPVHMIISRELFLPNVAASTYCAI